MGFLYAGTCTSHEYLMQKGREVKSVSEDGWNGSEDQQEIKE